MRFRLFRSRAFWCGVPGLVFLLWAWGDSMRATSAVLAWWKLPGLADSIRHGEGAIWITRFSDSFGGSPIPVEWRAMRDRKDAKAWFPPLGVAEAEISFTSVTGGAALVHRAPTLILPHWFLLLSYTAVWTGAIFWRWRKLRKAAREPDG